MAESTPNLDPKPKRLDISEDDVEHLLKAFEEEDHKEASEKKNEDIQSIAASLEELGNTLSKGAETKALLFKLIGKEAEEEANYLLENRKTELSGEEMVDMVIDLALERGGMKKDMKPGMLEAFKSNAELRAKTKQQLEMTLNAKLVDPSVGNDEEKVSRLMKAIEALDS